MKQRERLLAGSLLVLAGIVIGLLIVMFFGEEQSDDLNPVRFTEVKRSEKPLFTDEMLKKMDSRFLFKTVAQEVAPAVVYIETLVPVPESRYREEERESGDFWDRLLPRRIRTVGSGVIISSDGYIMTNSHVVEGTDGDDIEVILDDKRSFRGRVVGMDPTTDIAVIKIDARNLPTVTLGNSDKVEVGEWVLAIGNPFQLRSTVTAGIVSALSRQVNIIEEEMSIQSFIQTDAAINRGNSGGALLNTSGELIGINTAIASGDGSYQGYGFAVPSNLAGKVAGDLIQYGEVRRAMLGVSIVGVNAARASELEMERIRGVEIGTVTAGGPADHVGLQAGDVVLSVNDEPVNEANQLQQKIAVHSPGDTVTLRIWRDQREFNERVELALREEVQSGNGPSEENSETEGEYHQDFQFENFEELGFQVAHYRQEGGEAELVVTRVEEGGEAYRRGIRRGFRIIGVEGEEPGDLETMKERIERALEENGSVVLQVETPEERRSYFELKRP